MLLYVSCCLQIYWWCCNVGEIVMVVVYTRLRQSRGSTLGKLEPPGF